MLASEAPTIPLRSAFNSTAPANHLPTEIVIQILTSGAWSYWWDLVALTHICQRWRNVAFGTPQLWVDAARSGLKNRTTWLGGKSWFPVFLFLPVLLTRSEPYPIKIELPHPKDLTRLVKHEPAVRHHFARLCNLTVNVQYPGDVAEVLHIVISHLRTVEVLHIVHANRPKGTVPISLADTPPLNDIDLPRLHTLTIPGLCLTKSITVSSLKTLFLSDGPRSHDIFLAVLDRCSLTLQSLTLHRWTHPGRTTKAPPSAIGVVQLPALRHLEITLDDERDNLRLPTLLFASLSLPPRLTIHIDWRCFIGNTRELVPKYVVGLHAPPFFDSVILHLSRSTHWRWQKASIHCFINGTEYLRVQTRPVYSDSDTRRFMARFLGEHRYPTATQLAVDVNVSSHDESALRVQEDVLRRFVEAFPTLARLDLLGRTIGRAKLAMVKAFLDLPHPQGTGNLKTLGYVCDVLEEHKVQNPIGFVDALRAQLDALEALLADSVAAGGSRLHRLELCVTYTPFSPHPPPDAYPYTYGVSASTELTAYVSSTYLPRFGRLVDEVVFVGDVMRRGAGYRILTGAERRAIGPKRLPGGRVGGIASRSARKGR